MFLIQFNVENRGLEVPEAYLTMEEVYARLKALFIDTPHPWQERQAWLPDEEDDRIIVWKLSPNSAPSATPVWSFLGTHYCWDTIPGLLQTTDVLPGIGSLKGVIG